MYKLNLKILIEDFKEDFATHYAVETLASIIVLFVVLTTSGIVDLTRLRAKLLPFDIAIIFFGILRLIAIWISMAEQYEIVQTLVSDTTKRKKSILQEFRTCTLNTIITILTVVLIVIFGNYALLLL